MEIDKEGYVDLGNKESYEPTAQEEVDGFEQAINSAVHMIE